MKWYEKLQAEHKLWLDERYPGQKPEEPLLGLICEAGEAAQALLYMHKVSLYGNNPRHPTPHLELLDALGDCVLYVISWCNAKAYPASQLEWPIALTYQATLLDYGWDLVQTACRCYQKRIITPTFIDVLSSLCVTQQTSCERVAIASWEQVKERKL